MTFSLTERADAASANDALAPSTRSRARPGPRALMLLALLLATTGCYTQFQHPSDPYRREYPTNPSSEVVYGWYYPSYGAYCDYYVVPWWHDQHYSHGQYYPPIDSDSPSLPRGTAFGRGGERDGVVDDRTSAAPPATVSVTSPPVRPSDPPATPPDSNTEQAPVEEPKTSGTSGRGGRK